MKFPKKKREYLLEWLENRIEHYTPKRHPDFYAFMKKIINKTGRNLDLVEFTSGELTFIFNSKVGSGPIWHPWSGKKGILTIIARELESRGITRKFSCEFPVCWIPDLEQIRKKRS